VSEWRQVFFRRQLYEITYKQYLKTIKLIKESSPEMYEEMGLDQDLLEDHLTEWPEFFDIEDIPKLLKAELKAKPKLKDFKSMESYLQDYNIRDKLDRKMSELET